MRRLMLTMALVAAATTAQAKERVDRANIAATGEAPTSEITIEVTSGAQLLWRGSLRVGGNYGNTSFSQSKREHGEPCTGQRAEPGRSTSSNEQLNFNLNRYNGQQNPDGFSVNVNWVRPLSPCDGEGTTTVGFNRNITLAPGQALELDGGNGLRVKLMRQR